MFQQGVHVCVCVCVCVCVFLLTRMRVFFRKLEASCISTESPTSTLPGVRVNRRKDDR